MRTGLLGIALLPPRRQPVALEQPVPVIAFPNRDVVNHQIVDQRIMVLLR